MLELFVNEVTFKTKGGPLEEAANINFGLCYLPLPADSSLIWIVPTTTP